MSTESLYQEFSGLFELLRRTDIAYHVVNYDRPELIIYVTDMMLPRSVVEEINRLREHNVWVTYHDPTI